MHSRRNTFKIFIFVKLLIKGRELCIIYVFVYFYCEEAALEGKILSGSVCLSVCLQKWISPFIFQMSVFNLFQTAYHVSKSISSHLEHLGGGPELLTWGSHILPSQKVDLWWKYFMGEGGRARPQSPPYGGRIFLILKSDFFMIKSSNGFLSHEGG